MIKKRGKLLCLLLTTALTAGIISGCGSSGSSSNGSDGGVIKLSVWTPEGQEVENQYFKDTIEKFNKENEGKIEASIELIPRANGYEYENKINAAATSGGLPDVMAMDGPTVANYANSGIIVPIGDYFKKEDLTDFVPSIIQQGTYNDKLYTLGTSESDVVLYYNKTMLDAAGITPPSSLKDAWTWDDVYEISKKLTKDGVYGINMDWDLGEGQIYGFAPILWSNGAELLSKDGKKADGYVNSNEAVEALKSYERFAKEGLMNLQPLPNEFEEGKAALYLMGSWEVEKIQKSYPDLKWGITYYPTSSKTKKVVAPSGDWCWGITSGSKNAEAAAKLIAHLTSPESVEKYCTAINKPPSRVSILDKLDVYKKLPMSIIKDQVINAAHPRPISTSYPVLSKEFAAAMGDIRTGADIKSALDQVAQRFDEDIKKNK